VDDSLDATFLTPPRPRRALPVEVAEEVRWSFRRPWIWLSGVVVNLALSLAYLVVVPLTGHHRGSGVVLVGTYFANFILADVTTTNVFGPDAPRTRERLAQGEGLRRLLLVKNLTLLVIVGVPTLALTAALTEEHNAHATRGLAVTLPAVALPIFCWLALGDVVSVLLPVTPRKLRERWVQRHDRPNTIRWLAHFAVPYGLFFLVELLRLLPHTVITELPKTLAHTAAVHGVVLTAIGLVLWQIGLTAASTFVNHRGLNPY
jgi:hypothetical protein